MNHIVLKGLLISCLITITSAIEIDGKLDFGNSRTSPASFKSYVKEHRNTFVPGRGNNANTIKTTATNDDFDNIGVVCVSAGCNITELTTNTENTIQTDVLVHIQTKLDLNHDKKKVIEDIPDVPVVIGRGSKLDTTIGEQDSLDVLPQPQFVLDADPLPQLPTYNPVYPSTRTSFDSSINTYSSPSVTSSVPPSISSRVGSVSGSFDGSRVGSVSGSFDGFHPSVKTNTFYGTQRDSKVEFNMEPHSSVAIITSESDKSGKDIKYQVNGIEIKIPFFEPSYQNHYHGESPPPQYIWFNRKSNSINPVEFKTVKSTWTPSVWNRNVSPHRHTSTTVGSSVPCTCKEGQTTGLRWYPSASRGASIGDPGSQINDKLASLNE